jgi:hypothetical protein
MYDSPRGIELHLVRGQLTERNNATRRLEEKASVLGASQLLRETFWKRATMQGRLRLRAVLGLTTLVLANIFESLVSSTNHHHNRVSIWAYLLATILLGTFSVWDRLYYAVFPSTVILVRTGPRRWPYESIIFILGVLSIVVAVVVPFFVK